MGALSPCSDMPRNAAFGDGVNGNEGTLKRDWAERKKRIDEKLSHKYEEWKPHKQRMDERVLIMEQRIEQMNDDLEEYYKKIRRMMEQSQGN